MKSFLTFLAMLISLNVCHAQSLPLTAGSGQPLSGTLYTSSTGELINGIGTTSAFKYINFGNGTTNTLWGIEGTTPYFGSANDVVFGTQQNANLRFVVNNVVKATIDPSGNVGIGTTSPQSNLHVYSANSPAVIIQDNSSLLRMIPANGINYIESGTSLSNSYADIRFTSMNGATNWMNIQGSTGNVSIGTTDPQGHKLAVNGDIIATEVKVKLYANWPDYVFKPSYKLPSLTAIKTYIYQNQHLPEMPSAAEVEKNGLNLGEIVKIQTKKIEELTLYLIEKDNKDKVKDVKLQSQQTQIDQLKQMVETLSKEIRKN